MLMPDQALTAVQLLNDKISDNSTVSIGTTVVGENGIRGSHTPINIGGTEALLVIIGSHRYLVATGVPAIEGIPWFTDMSSDLRNWVPYVTGNTGEASLSLATPVVNLDDYYELDRLTSRIITAGAMNRTPVTEGFAAASARACTLGGLRWNLPNFEVMFYLWKNAYSYLPGNGIYWLPYSHSIEESWIINVGDISFAAVSISIRVSDSNEDNVLPVSII